MRYRLRSIIATAAMMISSLVAYAAINGPLYKILASDGIARDNFGHSVSIDGTKAIIGSPGDSDDELTTSGAAYLFDITNANQLFKLTPSDGVVDDHFGFSVAISGTRAIAGAPLHDANGPDSGAAYIFDTTTGLQLFKLQPDDAFQGDQFGSSVAIQGTRAIVGATFNDDNGASSGAAYIFDTTTGLQLFKLLPLDNASGDRFGFSVGLDGVTAIIGAINDDDFGSLSGSAYLFDATTGLQIHKLLPNDGAAADRFGWSVGISGVSAIVGAFQDDDNGTSSGSAYLFDTSTGLQSHKLLPNDNAEFDQFGFSVAISGTTSIVGARGDDDMGNNSGSAYLFDTTSGVQLNPKLLPEENATNDWFGLSVSISGTNAIIGAIQDDANGSDSGSAYFTAIDTDHDGLLDSWENLGIPYVDGGGVPRNFILPGANPNHKDLYVEIDSMVGLGFHATAQANVIAAFANAPNALVDNPDGLDGITLHLLIDETNIPVTPFPNKFADFDTMKTTRFGTPDERIASGPVALLAAKAKAYRYCIFGQSFGATSSSGLAEHPGNDFMVTLGLWTTPGGTINQQAGTFMHEFGHTLGLNHGGGDGINRKPNYYSVMSYTWQNPKAAYAASWRLDYSHVKLATLDEGALIEGDGIDGSDPVFAAISTLIGTGGEPPVTLWTTPDGTPKDWNLNGTIDAGTVAMDMNYHFQCIVGGVPTPCPSPGEVLVGHADWPNLRYEMFGASFADGIHDNTTDDTEMTLEIFEQMDAVPSPPVVCLADTNGDTMVNVADLLILLTSWGACPTPPASCPADIDQSGVINVADLLELLTSWGACP